MSFIDEENHDEFEIDHESDLLMHNYNTLPKKVKKYWRKRYKLFKKYDEGIYMTSELWYSVTPEAVAKATAKLIQSLIPDASNILDVCCGAGGNTIQFARYFRSVGAIDINPVNVKCTIHNAAIYGVRDRIWTVEDDWNKLSQLSNDGKRNISWIPKEIVDYSKGLQFDFAFCSPPWGGPSYNRGHQTFDLQQMKPFSVENLVNQLSKYSRNIGLFLPRSLDLFQLREITRKIYGSDAKCRVVYIKQEGYCIGLLALFGTSMISNHAKVSKKLNFIT